MNEDTKNADRSRVEPGATLPSTGSTAKIAHGLSAHMPGPWRVTVNGGFVNGVPSASVWVDAIEFYSVACVMPQKEVEANARLIAAAPDLLAALKQIVKNRGIAERGEHVELGSPCSICGERFGVRPSDPDEMCEDCLIDAAIANAEGVS